MPFGSEGLEPGTALALSGGGFRATLFHLGAVWRLLEVEVLQQLKRISSVSGGSLTSGKLAREWTKLAAASWSPDAFRTLVVDPLRSLCARNVDVPSMIKGTLALGKSIADFVAGEYDDVLFHGTSMQDLPDAPRFVFNSTNLATGVDFRFSKPYAGDYRIGLIEKPTFKLASAVAASSAFPPFLSPFELHVDPSSFENVPGADLHDDERFRNTLRLTDGGVYDNLGLETVEKRFKKLLVSDAGAPFSYGGIQGSDWPRQTLRIIDILSHQSRSRRLRTLVAQFHMVHPGSAYWGIATPVDTFGTPGALAVPRDVTHTLARLRTRLNHFSDVEQCSLVNLGYAVCDASVRKTPGIVAGGAPAPAWPYPEFALDRGLRPGIATETWVAEPPAEPGGIWVVEHGPDDTAIGGG